MKQKTETKHVYSLTWQELMTSLGMAGTELVSINISDYGRCVTIVTKTDVACDLGPPQQRR